ncbi:F-box protein [Rhynchospora pubera]|uniref:F-box protein n=1 Tax=Rhynchospora pubera TaxID=906938 RepID=A0AAV8DQ88_9POAL|nr:F-box protein [Rhynchospora pubera]
MGRGEDRISNLPNEILQFILCLVPLKYAIRTSTLSKRWRHLWQYNLISSTSLQFGEDFSCNQSPMQFAATLDRYLQLHEKRNLDKFGILLSPFDILFPNFENWVATVLDKGVKELEIDLSQGVLNSYRAYYMDDRMPFVICNSLFRCNSLTHLSLSRCNFSDPSDFTNFVGLRSLSLDNVDLVDEMLTTMLENCVSLECICLKRCENLEVVKFVGDKLKLKNLAIVDCRGVSDMEISAPELQSFLYHGWISFSTAFGNVSKVTDAYLCSDGLEEEYEEVFFRILSDFSHVKVLTICSVALMNIVIEEQELNEPGLPLELQNLQEFQLIMDSISEEHLYCVFSFFRLCPSPYLEKLFIQLPINFYQQKDISDLVTAEQNTPNIVFRNLRWIKITNFEGTPLELKLVKFFLEKAIVLQSIFIVLNQCDISSNSLFVRIIEGQLSVIPKASKDANIVMCGPFDHDCMINPTHTIIYHQEQYRKGTTVQHDHATIRVENIPLDQDFL